MRVMEDEGKYLVVSDRGSILGEFESEDDANEYVDKYSTLKSYVNYDKDDNSLEYKELKKRLNKVYNQS